MKDLHSYSSQSHGSVTDSTAWPMDGIPGLKGFPSRRARQTVASEKGDVFRFTGDWLRVNYNISDEKGAPALHDPVC